MRGHSLPWECGCCEAGYFGQNAALYCCDGWGLAIRPGTQQ